MLAPFFQTFNTQKTLTARIAKSLYFYNLVKLLHDNSDLDILLDTPA
jgi:hypothetical protein